MEKRCVVECFPQRLLTSKIISIQRVTAVNAVLSTYLISIVYVQEGGQLSGKENLEDLVGGCRLILPREVG